MSNSLIVFAILVAGFLAYWFPIRGWYRRSGAARLDALRAMSGDVDVVTPTYETTLTILVEAAPLAVWYWLLQMGRGGQRPIEELRALKVGDVIRTSLAPRFPITAIEPGRTLVLGGGRRLQWSWQFELYPVDERRTRLISRNRIRSSPTLGSALFALFLQPIAFVITRKMMFDVKRRAERERPTSATAGPRAA